MDSDKSQTQTMSDLRVRRARAEDYRAIMDINRNVYAGFDYLPSLYFVFLHHPDVYMWVAELDGQIVGFSACYCVEARRVVYNFAARVHPGYQDLGLFGKILDARNGDLKSILPRCFYERRIESFNVKIHPTDGSHADDEVKIVSRYHHLVYSIDSVPLAHNLSKHQLKDQTSRLKSFCLDQTIEILQHPDTMARLKSNSDFLTAHTYWLPLEITKQNLAKLAKECNVYLSMSGPNNCHAVSFCSWILNPDKSVLIQLDYFGANNVNTLTSHVVAQMGDVIKKCVPAATTLFRVILAFPWCMNAKFVEERMVCVLGERNREIRNFKTKGTLIVDSINLISKL